MSSAPHFFEVNVEKEDFKFNAAHFVAFDGFRERLHGHNYRVGVRLTGNRRLGADGYVVDFGCIKTACKTVCKRLNEHFLCPIYSPVLTTVETDETVSFTCQDGAHFLFPKSDCAMLPIVHASAEELAVYLWGEILHCLDADYLRQRGIETMQVTVAEAPGQEAVFRYALPPPGSNLRLDVRAFVETGAIVPMPCTTDTESAVCCINCQASTNRFTQQLQQLAEAMNSGQLNGPITVETLQSLLHKK